MRNIRIVPFSLSSDAQKVQVVGDVGLCVRTAISFLNTSTVLVSGSRSERRLALDKLGAKQEKNT